MKISCSLVEIEVNRAFAPNPGPDGRLRTVRPIIDLHVIDKTNVDSPRHDVLPIADSQTGRLIGEFNPRFQLALPREAAKRLVARHVDAVIGVNGQGRNLLQIDGNLRRLPIVHPGWIDRPAEPENRSRRRRCRTVAESRELPRDVAFRTENKVTMMPPATSRLSTEMIVDSFERAIKTPTRRGDCIEQPPQNGERTSPTSPTRFSSPRGTETSILHWGGPDGSHSKTVRASRIEEEWV